jgi:glucosamine--fructose-6-phosphate aminotransferase (isomerizing)
MCGIFGYIGQQQNAAELVLEGLKKLEYRGYDSWGVAAVEEDRSRKTEGGKIAIKKKAGKIGNATVEDMPKSSFAFGHTRWATHGGVTDINAHPHLDCTGTVAVVHNGIVENFEELKEELAKAHHRFVSETDTEIIVHRIEEYLKKYSFEEAVRKTFNRCTGLNAIIAIHSGKRVMVAVRNGSPLVLGFGKDENFVASDASALLSHTREVQFLEDGDMAVVGDTNVAITNVATGKKREVKKLTLNWTMKQAEKGTYPFFMLKEIYEQQAVIKGIAHTSIKQIEHLANVIKKSYGTYMVGCGSASYVALAGSYLFSKIAKRHVNYAIGSEFGYHLDFLTPKSTVIALSQSGETMDILESVKKAKEKGATIVAITNVLGSTLYRISDEKILIGAGPEIAVASTKAVTGKLAILVLLAYALSGKTKEGIRVLTEATESVSKLLEKDSIHRIETLAKNLLKKEHVYVIGRGLSYPASLETAIKIKEISYIHAEGMAAGELKHGPLALVEKGTPCIAFLPDDETYGANLAGAMEMKARGGYVIGISHKNHEVFDYHLPVDDAREATIIPNIVMAQLLSYYLSILKGLDPDKPRNLAKSVTVK